MEDRVSELPFVLEGGSGSIQVGWASTSPLSRLLARIPPSVKAVSGYLAAGVVLGIALIVLFSVFGVGAPTKSSGVVSDDIVHLHARDIGETCWRGSANASHAKLTVAIEIGLDGKVRSASANGDSPTMRGCVEQHVRGWEFLPQASSSQMVLPFEVDPR